MPKSFGVLYTYYPAKGAVVQGHAHSSCYRVMNERIRRTYPFMPGGISGAATDPDLICAYTVCGRPLSHRPIIK